MKVLIQNVRSGQYLSTNGCWSAAPGDARDFHYSSCAYAAMKKEQSRGLRVLFYFEDLDYSITVRRGVGEQLSQRLSAGAFDF